MAGVPVIRTAPTVSISTAASGPAFNIYYSASSYVKFSNGFNSGAVQVKNPGVIYAGITINKTIVDDAVKGPDHVAVIATAVMPVAATSGSLSLSVNGGPRYFFGNNLTYNGGWTQLVGDPTAAPDVGTALTAGTAVTNVSAYLDMTFTGSAESMFEAAGMAIGWVGKEISVDGGTSTAGNEITLKSISDVDRSQTRSGVSPYTGNFFGHVEDSAGAIKLAGPVQIGNLDGVTVTHMLEKDTYARWTDAPVNLKFYRLDIVGAGTTVIFGDMTTPAPVTIDSGLNRWALDTATNEPAGFSAYGCTFKHGRAWKLGSTTLINDSVVQDVTDITLNAATDICGTSFITSPLHANFIPASTLLVGTVIRDIPITAYGLTITGAYSGATLTLDGTKFTNNAAGHDIDFAHTGDITIALINGATMPSYTITNGGTVIDPVIGQVTTTITAKDLDTKLPIQGARVYLIADTGGPLPAGTVIISGLTDVNGQIADTRSLTGNQPVTGHVRMSTTSPLYQDSPISAVIDSGAGLSVTALMLLDE